MALGAAGESLACTFLLQQHYRILDRNCRYRLQEIDIVALDPIGQEVVFVEVKTRSSSTFGDPSLAVNHRKLKSLIKVAEIYLRRKKLPELDYRFDIVTVVGKEVNHYPNVTWEMVK